MVSMALVPKDFDAIASGLATSKSPMLNKLPRTLILSILSGR